jgi:hypothetical protein
LVRCEVEWVVDPVNDEEFVVVAVYVMIPSGVVRMDYKEI